TGMADRSIAVVLRRVHNLAGVKNAERCTDAQLLARLVKQRDAHAFEALLRRHGPLVWRVCRRLLANRQSAEDAFQATFLVLARRAGTIRKPDSLASWL